MKLGYPLNRLKLEQFVLGELPDDEVRQIEERMKLDSKLVSEYEEIITANQAILNKYPAEMMARAIEERIDKQNSREKTPGSVKKIFKKSIPFIGGLALAAMALFVIYPLYFIKTPDFNSRDELVFAKGQEARMILYLKEGNDSRVLRAGEKLKQGDQLRISYFSGEAPYGVIFSIDGRNTITLHFPEASKSLPLIETKKETLLDYSYELDDAPFYEKFYFITSRNPFDVDFILDRAEKMILSKVNKIPGGLDLGDGFGEYSLLIQKEDF